MYKPGDRKAAANLKEKEHGEEVLELHVRQVEEEGPDEREAVEDAAELDHLGEVSVAVEDFELLAERLKDVEHKHAIACNYIRSV